jgi:hypothetical protein
MARTAQNGYYVKIQRRENMKTVARTLEMPADTFEALERLAKITGALGGVPEVIQDALRVYEWAAYHQANGDQVVAGPPFTPEQIQGIEKSSLNIEVLTPLFEKEATEEARQFFKAA